MIGLCGAHRTGKTTLARAYAEKAGIEFVRTSASQVFKDLDLNPALDYPFDMRMDIQELILKSFQKQYAAANRFFVSDRTPIDMIAYTLSDVRQETLTEEQDKRLQKYISDCYDATSRFFATLIIVQPGIAVVPDEGKATLMKSYIDHIAMLVTGAVSNEMVKSNRFYIPVAMTDLETRVNAVDAAVKRTIFKHVQTLEEHRDLGCPVTFH